MSIHSITHLIGSPIALVLVYLGYKSLMIDNYPYSLWMLAPLTALILLYLFKAQIDYWWHTKYPIKFDEELGKFLKKNNSYYAGLTGEAKNEFENRLNLYMEAREFKAVGTQELKDTPYDLKALLSAIAIQLTMHKKDFLLGDMDRIFLYKHPFPTPNMQFLHTVETHVEDGVFIFSLEQFELAQREPEKYYNVVWYGFIDAFLKVYKDKLDPIEKYATLEQIEGISKFTEENILLTTGLKAIDPMVVLISLYFTHREQLKQFNPILYAELTEFFQIKSPKSILV